VTKQQIFNAAKLHYHEALLCSMTLLCRNMCGCERGSGLWKTLPVSPWV